MKRILMLVVVVFAIMMLASAVAADSNPLKDQCKDGGWQGLYGLAPDGTLLEFKNQGQCIEYVNHGGELVTCPCYSAESLQTYYEIIEDEFDGWDTYADDYQEWWIDEHVSVLAPANPYSYYFSTWKSSPYYGYACSASTYYPVETHKSAYNLMLEERQVCVETLLQSELFQNAKYQYIYP